MGALRDKRIKSLENAKVKIKQDYQSNRISEHTAVNMLTDITNRLAILNMGGVA